jgi:hypothetical protein
MTISDFDLMSPSYEEGFFDLRPEAVALLLDLATPVADGPILVVASDRELVTGAQSRGYPVVETSGEDGLSAQIGRIAKSGPYGGAIIAPPFNVEVREPSVPSDWPQLRRWFAEEYLIAHAWSQLAPGARVIAFVSSGLLALAHRKSARRALLDHGLLLVAALPNAPIWTAPHNAGTYLTVSERRDRSASSVSLVDITRDPRLPPLQAFTDWIEGKTFPALDVRPVTIEQSELSDDLRIDPAFYDPVYLELRAPLGFREYRLGDIAEINAGVRVDSSDRLTTSIGKPVPFVQVRHLRAHSIDQPYWIRPEKANLVAAKRALPGDILVSSSGTVGKVVLVGPDYPEGVLFDTSIRRVRITENGVPPESVAEFLQSELGQQQFRRLTSGTVIPHLSSANLAQMRVFLPLAAVDQPTGELPATTVTAPVLTQAQALAQAIEDQVLTVLRKADDTADETWRQRVASSLQQLAAELTPKPLAEIVRQEFPAPLAIAFRRFDMARHNPYEQLDRMINLVEACTYFAFHVLLANYSRAYWRDGIELPKEAMEALRSRATFDDRIRFIRAVTEAVQQHKLEVFMPELVEAEVDVYADRFRTGLRNPVAHSAPGSEAYVCDLIQRHRGDLEAMLERLRFLRQYSMCRIRSYYFHQGCWHYQVELYRGEEYDVNIQELQLRDMAEEGGRLIPAERDHLMLLSPEYEALDLWPYYQLHFSDLTCRESHLCFVKHFTAADEVLHGESVRSGIELRIPGFADYFRNMVRRSPA